nr:hypothetical protein [Tanacetum cinerariifolium]
MAKKHLDADSSETPVDQTKYRSMVRALMYLTASRTDIVHATCYCARYQAKPIEKHLTAVKRIFRFGSRGLSRFAKEYIWWHKFLGGDKLVSWSSRKQDCTSMSSAEFEYVSLSVCCAQVLWMRTQFTDYGFLFDKIPMYCNSKASIAISCNPVQHSRGEKLVSWLSTKQDCTLMSLAEAEYVFLSACCTQVLWLRTQLIDYGFPFDKIPMYCDSKASIAISCNPVQHYQAEYVSLYACYAQVLWMRTQLTDYGFHFDKIPMYCDSKAAIAILCNPVQHSCTKHIDVRCHFIKEKVEKAIVELFFIRTEYQLADLITKALPIEKFKYLVRRLGGSQLQPSITKIKNAQIESRAMKRSNYKSH